MELTDGEMVFIERRKKLIKIWPTAGSGLGITMIILTAWLYSKTPLLIDPFTTMHRLSEGSIPETTLMLMAGMLPILFLACLGLLVMLIIFVTVMLHNEKRYLTMIETLSRKSPSAEKV